MPEYTSPQEQSDFDREPTAPPPPTPSQPPAPGPAGGGREKILPPAIALMVVSGVSAAVYFTVSLLMLLGVGIHGMGGGPGASRQSGEFLMPGIFYGGLGVLQSGILMLANKMRRLENYRTAMTVAIVSVIPLISPCCLLGIPFGIWALVMLSRPEVRDAFAQAGR